MDGRSPAHGCRPRISGEAVTTPVITRAFSGAVLGAVCSVSAGENDPDGV